MTKAINDSVSEIISREFGANADYVGEILERYLHDASLVDDDWREYFEKTLGIAPPPATTPAAVAPVASAPVAAVAPVPASAPASALSDQHQPIRGVALKIVENMQSSLEVPTATTFREIPIKVLDENRRILNEQLTKMGRAKVSYTHIIAFAMLKGLKATPSLNHGFQIVDGEPYRIVRDTVNFGLAIDVTRKDGTRSLVVPNVKNADAMNFAEFVEGYDDIVRRGRSGKLTLDDFAGTTVSLTNPGGLGTSASNPRLMQGQGAIFATGSIDYPPEYQAMTPEALSRIGISKVMTITSTYDHRIIQGAESGQFLARVHELLLGKDEFYTELFTDLGVPFMPVHWAMDDNPALVGGDQRTEEIEKQARVFELITMYRVRGHLNADIDPLGLSNVKHHPELDMEYHGLTLWDLDREFVTGGLGGTETATLREILAMLKRYYCGSVGYEYRHIQGPEEKGWLRARIESDPPPIDDAIRKQLLWKLISAEAFERFLGRKYIGQKRFSVEGGETIVAVLDRLVDEAALAGVEDVTIGMSHRGRLNILANVVGKFCERIFTNFEGAHHPAYPHDVRDVKYHQGATGERETADGRKIKITVSPNPSHLEFVNPVVEGRVRAKQDRAGADGVMRFLPVLLHGDAAFAGEGVVAETLNMSLLDGYKTGGTIHIIVNNQIGFTTSPEQGRSSTYSTDVARMVQAPIFHVNGDDADAAYNTLKMAFEYRQKFQSDVVIDLLGFRRHGHNEGDEPTYTQPVMYQRVDQHPGARVKYGSKLVGEGLMTQEEIDALVDERYRRYENALAGAKEIVAQSKASVTVPPPYSTPERVEIPDTGLSTEKMREIAEALTHVPSQFNLNPKVVTLLSRRHKMADGEVPVDWGVAEALAFASLVLEGTPVRISGEDSSRGTFSHRHAVFVDTKTGEKWTPIKHLSPDQARFEIYDSPLSETGVLGFEYGYSIDSPETLVLWEAQFGDFVNVAQVIIDQFIVAGEAKWGQPTRLTLLLPHGYEGQGPEHSSARLERFLQLCAEGNMQVCYPSTPAQIFHLLRRQARLEPARPLVVMTPKSLLRLPEASSSIDRITSTGFKPVMEDPTTPDPNGVRKVVFTCGKLYYDISAGRAKSGQTDIALVRVEQFYPFPKANLAEIIARYPNATSIVWAQEEPMNMGAWTFMQPRLWKLVGSADKLAYIGRRPGASTATGSYPIHQMEQKRLVDEALA